MNFKDNPWKLAAIISMIFNVILIIALIVVLTSRKTQQDDVPDTDHVDSDFMWIRIRSFLKSFLPMIPNQQKWTKQPVQPQNPPQQRRRIPQPQTRETKRPQPRSPPPRQQQQKAPPPRQLQPPKHLPLRQPKVRIMTASG